MKTKLILVLLVLLSSSALSQKILLKISNTITGQNGEILSAVELKQSTTPPTNPQGGNTGHPVFETLMIKKPFANSTNYIWRASLQQGGPNSFFPTVDLEYYNAGNVLYYKITLINARVYDFFYLSPQCPGCITLEHQIGFRFDKIEMMDPSISTSVGTIKYNLITNSFY
jgi:type VI protein secretion system component Hcp